MSFQQLPMSEILERIKTSHQNRSKEERLNVLKEAGLVNEEGQFLEEFASRRREESDNSDSTHRPKQ